MNATVKIEAALPDARKLTVEVTGGANDNAGSVRAQAEAIFLKLLGESAPLIKTEGKP